MVSLSGIVYTARDDAHGRLVEMANRGEAMPFAFPGQAVFYADQPRQARRPIGSVGPTTGSRMDAYSPRLMEMGLKIMIGKGSRSEEVIEAIKSTAASTCRYRGHCRPDGTERGERQGNRARGTGYRGDPCAKGHLPTAYRGHRSPGKQHLRNRSPAIPLLVTSPMGNGKRFQYRRFNHLWKVKVLQLVHLLRHIIGAIRGQHLASGLEEDGSSS